MPDLQWNKRWGEQALLFKTGESYFAKHPIYGYQWGDPHKTSSHFVLDEYIRPYVHQCSTVCEIGPGGGRYSQFLAECNTLYLVEFNVEFFDILSVVLADSFCLKRFIQSPGSSLPGVPSQEIDFLFSFDCFVHLDIPLILGYLHEIRRVLKPSGVAVVHYADKTKPGAQQQGANFSNTTPAIFNDLLAQVGFSVVKEDTSRISHSAIVAFQIDKFSPYG
jgi:ubiquinone/menaquinone biosynthesis C-methylase UbiE